MAAKADTIGNRRRTVRGPQVVGPGGDFELVPGMAVMVDISFFNHPELHGARIETGYVIERADSGGSFVQIAARVGSLVGGN
mgnify:CR=1 FL=1